MENVEQVEQKETKGNLKSWVKKHKTKIVTGVTLVGGLCLLKLTYREGYNSGVIDSTLPEIIEDNIEETISA